ncbi:SEC23 [Symbiodinium sp. CCMP2592]|nr:SEC23 [Symbiodinium sp. CCMP2592]
MGFRGVRTTRLQALAAAVAATWCWGCYGVFSQAWLLPQAPAGRRELLGAGLAGLGLAIEAEPALASGGSTAGKYSTIPSGKRRFYGRVKQGLYQYLQMEPAIKAGNLKDPLIEDFFSKNIIKVKGGEDIKNCGFGAKCKTKEKRTSRWLDFKTASDLLAGAFRYSAEDIPEYLPQVKIIRSFAKKVEKMEAAIEAGNAEEAQQLYAKSKLDLSRYLPQVELEPLDSKDYTHPWDTRPEVICQGTFCV